MTANIKPKRIVLTGGPCAGKTTVLEHITAHCSQNGIKAFCVPEVASILIGGGADLGALDLDGLLSFERNLIQTQLLLEETYLDLAARWNGPAVVICDRGTMDVSAYLPEHVWRVLLNGYGWTEVALRDQRYDAVIHLVSAAVGAPEFYTTENNAARNETAEQAASLDAAVQNAWIGHPHLRVINATQDFDKKVAQTLAVVDGLIGKDSNLEIERKYLLDDGFDASSLPVHHKTFLIEQTYLKNSDGGVERVRSRRADGAASYTHTVKRKLKDGVREEIERAISGDEYIALLERADPSREQIQKNRHCFLWGDLYFELDSFLGSHQGLNLLEVELMDLSDSPTLPEFIPVSRDVTSEGDFTNAALARKDR